MPGSLDRPRESQSVSRNSNIKLIALPILGVVALIAFAISHPGVAKWISDAAQAEFVGADDVPDLVPPTQLAQPDNQIRTVKAY